MVAQLRNLPPDIQQRIYAFAGPDPTAKEAHDEFLSHIKTGKIGIPAWHTTIEAILGKQIVNRHFVIPSYDYYEIRKIKKLNWWFPEGLEDYYYSKYRPVSPYRFAFSYRMDELVRFLRRDTCIVPDKDHCICAEGGFENPAIPLSFREADDYDLLFSMKPTRGKNVEDALKGLESWYRFRKDYETDFPRDTYCYVDRIYWKWKTLLRAHKLLT